MKKIRTIGKLTKKFTAIILILALMATMMLSGCSKETGKSEKITGTESRDRKSDPTAPPTDHSDPTAPFLNSGDSGAASDGSGSVESSRSTLALAPATESKASADYAGDDGYFGGYYGEGDYADYFTGAELEYSGSDFTTFGKYELDGGDYSLADGYGEEGLTTEIDPIDPILPDPEEKREDYPRPAAGLLTAGEWNDNLHYDFLKNLIANGQQQDYSSFFTAWDLTPFSRLAVHVSSGEIVTNISGSAIGTTNVNNADVTVYSADGDVIWQSKTNNKGMTYVFYRLNGGDAVPAKVVVTSGSFTTEKYVESTDLLDDNTLEVILSDSAFTPKKLDLMFVIDTTGSMWDEIRYLQKELEDVIERVEGSNSNLPIRLSVNFYRDLHDEYIVRSNPFSSDISSQLVKLNAEGADGGGDYEEAVELALEDAVNNHDWDEDSTKLVFMVLDAPPHNTSSIRESLASSITDAINKGIRIIPVASSGVDKSTEFLLRTFAMTTGGTYTFLTDHSGIGGSHIEPTIGSYDVENLNDLLVRIINEYLS